MGFFDLVLVSRCSKCFSLSWVVGLLHVLSVPGVLGVALVLGSLCSRWFEPDSMSYVFTLILGFK